MKKDLVLTATLLGLACIIGGIVLAIVKAEQTVTLTLIGAGAAALASVMKILHTQAESSMQRAERAERKATEAFEETQTLRREIRNTKE